jgi:hypothetical protein
MPEVKTKLRDAQDRVAESDYLVGLFYYRQKWYRGSIDRFNTLLKSDPEYTRRDDVYFYLAESYVKGITDTTQARAQALPLYEKLVTEFQKSEHLQDAPETHRRTEGAGSEQVLEDRWSTQHHVHARHRARGITCPCADAGTGLTVAQVDVPARQRQLLGVVPVDAPIVMGNQDTVTRALVGDTNQIVINAGTDRGVQFNQKYFVRRIYRNADDLRSPEPHLVETTGWLHITAVNKTMALAAVDHTCSHLLEGDFLEPFHAPIVPDDIAVAETTGELDFKAYGRVLYGDRERWSAGTGDYMLIDRGTDKNVSSAAISRSIAIVRSRACP